MIGRHVNNSLIVHIVCIFTCVHDETALYLHSIEKQVWYNYDAVSPNRCAVCETGAVHSVHAQRTAAVFQQLCR